MLMPIVSVKKGFVTETGLNKAFQYQGDLVILETSEIKLCLFMIQIQNNVILPIQDIFRTCCFMTMGWGVENLLEGVSYFILQIISVDNPM